MLHHLSRAKQLESSLEDPLSRRAQQLYERNELKLVKTIAMSVTSLLLSLAAIWTAVAERALLLALSSALSLLLVVLALVLNALPVPLVVALALNSGASLALSLALRRQQTSASLRFEPEVVFKRNI
ncbi:unnamed protein product [Oppiella nova]|uniref:Uncharacterized protein n=1 Tax=Oppiella nova TaxID=334625 RepID=A0A7R9MJ89_9ACAR|nr:unnamed protein product [Oppiella nova]CAG2178377.1 unnamed protein product [Oppiella nova]